MSLSVSILGVPLGFGQGKGGVDLGPSAIRVAGLADRIAKLGIEVHDLDDLEIKRPHSHPPAGENLKYLAEVQEACERLALKAEEIVDAGDLPITIGGDHSIAIGSLAGVVKSFRKRNEKLGLIYFDAHADMNTPETTPSGNIHGMPLAVLFGRGAPELVNVAGFAPKIAPGVCAHVGGRDIDPGERELIDAIAIARRETAGYAVTFDVDVLDPRDAPGSGTLVRGGLSDREAHLAMEKIADDGGLRSLEVVEINTALDVNNRTAELGVELILSALGKTIL
ncbi:MAG: arginase [Acidobacteria bacterium]|nr:MAG: arginase [Acidobacteriota bacterium]